MDNISRDEALNYHENGGRPGKIEVVPTTPYSGQRELALAYSPGVAWPCKEIAKDPEAVYRFTDKGNLVAVISNGTAVLGLGNIGPLAAKPVMEGKALLFKIFAGIDSFDIEVDETDPGRMIEVVKAIAPTFGGINLEDIKAPECFEIETKLKEALPMPLMHDDQHGTAIIATAGLINALMIRGKKEADVRVTINGAGAAAISCARMFVAAGVKKEHIIMCDSKGPITTARENLTATKREFATSENVTSLADAMKGADVFLGLSVKDAVTPDMLRTMAPDPIVFALANPDPEIPYEKAIETIPGVIMATGRSDYPNQVNNVLGFPYIFRGALDSRASAINEEMKMAAAKAIAALAREEVPEQVKKAYNDDELAFGPGYILPKPLDPRLLTTVAPEVARAAMESGVAGRTIADMDEYRRWLACLVAPDSDRCVVRPRDIDDFANLAPGEYAPSAAMREQVIELVTTRYIIAIA